MAKVLRLCLFLHAALVLAPTTSIGAVGLEPIRYIGATENEPPLGIGVAACVAKGQEILVVDRQTIEVRRYSQDGRWLGNVGRLGEGPGEFQSPKVVCVDASGRIYVGGHPSWVEVFEADGTPSHRIQLVTQDSVSSIAVDSEGFLFVVSFDLTTETMIHRYDARTGDYLGSFGDSFAAALGREDVDVRVEQSLASGVVDLWKDKVVYMQNWPQEIRVYTRDGALVRTIEARRDEAGPFPKPTLDGASIELRLPETFGLGLAVSDEDVVWCGLYMKRGGTESSVIDAYDLRSGDRVASFAGAEQGSLVQDATQGALWVSEIRDNVPVITEYRLTDSSR